MMNMNELLEKTSKAKAKAKIEEAVIVEKSPDGQYFRYNEILGRGAFKTVYKGFDEVNGIEIAWSQVSTDSDALESQQQHYIEGLYSEVHLLKSLRHENIVKCYSHWVDEIEKSKTINIITEYFTSGSLRQFHTKHKRVHMTAIKKWARQILRGLHYLHSQDPPIIHGYLRCDNIFVNGNRAEVKIGGLELASVMQQPRSSVVGTSEFLIPELYQLVDICSFGMCMIELVTCECPYSECKNQAQIYKVMSGVMKPTALDRVKDPQVRQFIEKCVVPTSIRLSAAELLKDPFLSSENSKGLLLCDPLVPIKVPKCDSLPMHINTNDMLSAPEFEWSNAKNEFRLRGEKADDNSVSLTLCITNLCGQVNTIEFKFDLDTDTVPSIAGEMVEQLNFLSNDEEPVLVKSMDRLIDKLVPNWENSSADSNGLTGSYGDSSILQHDQNSRSLSVLRSDDGITDQHSKGLNGYGSERSEGGVGGSVITSESTKNSEIPPASSSALSNEMSSLSVSSPSAADKDKCDKLKLKLDAIEMEYYQHFCELMRKREDAMYNARHRLIKKN